MSVCMDTPPIKKKINKKQPSVLRALELPAGSVLLCIELTVWLFPWSLFPPGLPAIPAADEIWTLFRPLQISTRFSLVSAFISFLLICGHQFHLTFLSQLSVAAEVTSCATTHRLTSFLAPWTAAWELFKVIFISVNMGVISATTQTYTFTFQTVKNSFIDTERDGHGGRGGRGQFRI